MESKAEANAETQVKAQEGERHNILSIYFRSL